jgi:recombination protein RecA
VTEAELGRLGQQAQAHGTAVVCLTRKPAQAASLGSLIGMRAEASAEHTGPDRFRCGVAVLKDKRHGAGWRHEEVLRGPPGLH